MMKVYLAKFLYPSFPFCGPWYKHGYCLHDDADMRFAGKEYDPFRIKILGSMRISHPSYDQAVILCKEVESYLQSKFPKNFVLEEHLDLPAGCFNGLSGITEMFCLPKGVTEKNLLDFFYKVKYRVDSNPRFNER